MQSWKTPRNRRLHDPARCREGNRVAVWIGDVWRRVPLCQPKSGIGERDPVLAVRQAFVRESLTLVVVPRGLLSTRA
jgi:hypothetical protein